MRATGSGNRKPIATRVNGERNPIKASEMTESTGPYSQAREQVEKSRVMYGGPDKPQAGARTGMVSERRNKTRRNEITPLAHFVTERLEEMDMRQSEFCRVNGFDQGMLSKIQNSVTSNLSLESVLRLSIGLSVSPERIFSLIGRMDLHDLVTGAYSSALVDLNRKKSVFSRIGNVET